MRAAILQTSSSDNPSENLRTVQAMMQDAVEQGAEFVLTPEVVNCVSTSRSHQNEVLSLPEDDEMLAGLCRKAADLKVWLLIGSLAVKTRDLDGRFANRSYLISSNGAIVAEYDKIHMFDVKISEQESFRESAGYRPGTRAVIADAPFGPVGLSVCYDMRFPQLYQALTKAGARILTVPSAFSPVTGAAHWHSLLRARAIETGCFVIAPAQTGTHVMSKGKPRSTYGHSLVVSPWGEVILDAGTDAGVFLFDMELDQVDEARRRVPSLQNAREFEGPEL